MTAPEGHARFRTLVMGRLAELGQPQRWLGEEIGAHLGVKAVAQTTVSSWLSATTNPGAEQVFAMEVVLGFRPGQLSRHLGYLPVDARHEAPTTEGAIRNEPIPQAAQRALLAALREMRKL